MFGQLCFDNHSFMHLGSNFQKVKVLTLEVAYTEDYTIGCITFMMTLVFNQQKLRRDCLRCLHTVSMKLYNSVDQESAN